ncbi:MAG: hypothetical protein DBX47_03320 [Clostridiales bacterium]|nr:MAG: hypothetical protein DBX47_03320 [Clostridiales bacterium]
MQAFFDLFRLKKNGKYFLKALVFCALLVAMGIVSEMFGFEMALTGVPKGDKVNIASSFMVLAGFMFGPLWGGIAALVQDIIGCLLKGDTPLLQFMIAPFLTGFLSGFFPFIFKKASKKLYGIVLYCSFISITAFLINTLCIVWTYIKLEAFWSYAVLRLPTLPFKIALYSIVVYILYCEVLPRIQKTKFGPDDSAEKIWKNG